MAMDNFHEFDACPILGVHSDIIQTHILTRLDGPTLMAAETATSHLRANDSLWTNICHTVWPSTSHPLIRHIISSFPSRHRSFYADSSSTSLPHNQTPSVRANSKGKQTVQADWASHQLGQKNIANSFLYYLSLFYFSFEAKNHIFGNTQRTQEIKIGPARPSVPLSPRSSPSLISAVDIYYKNKHVISKVLETSTESGLWSGSNFLVELLDPTHYWTIPGKFDPHNLINEYELEKNLTLSWILIDPALARATNLTNIVPTGANWNWATQDVEVRFGKILYRKEELVECRIVVTCEGWANEDLHVKQVSMEVVDADENKLGWTESLLILHESMEGRKRRSERIFYDEFTKMKNKRKLWKKRRRQMVEILITLFVVLRYCGFVTVQIFLLVFRIFSKWGRNLIEMMM